MKPVKANNGGLVVANDGKSDFVVTADGEYISQRKTAKLLKIAESTLRDNLKKCAVEAKKVNNIDGLNARDLTVVCTHFAQKGNIEAAVLLGKFAEAGAKAYIYMQAGYNPTPAQAPTPAPQTIADKLSGLLVDVRKQQKEHNALIAALKTKIEQQNKLLKRSEPVPISKVVQTHFEKYLLPSTPKALESKKASKPCWLYVLHSVETGYTKVGVSQSPETRSKAIRTASGRDDLEMIALLKTDSAISAKRLEKTVFKAFDKFRRAGEWFCLPSEDLQTLTDCITHTLTINHED